MKIVQLQQMQIGVGEHPDGACVIVISDDREQYHVGLTPDGRKEIGRLLLGIQTPRMVVPGHNGGA